MKKLILVYLLLLTARPLWAQQAGQFGAGVALGSPVGVTGKYWLDGTKAVDFGLGASSRGNFAAYADFALHGWDILPQPGKGKLGLYVSAGPRVENENGGQFGIRTMGGLSYWIENHPAEMFAEAGPVFELGPDSGVDVDGALGVRIYFAGGGKK